MDLAYFWSLKTQDFENGAIRDEIERVIEERDALLAAITEHHRQKADDRCIEDDDRLYATAHLPAVDRRVGDKTSMLINCARFIERRCEGGGWPSYVELEGQRDALLAAARGMRTVASSARDWMYESWSVENNRAWEALMAAVDNAEAGR